ncbi:MAG: ISNCY family transposase [Rhodopila sp.]
MRKRPRPQPVRALSLTPVTVDCPECQHRLHADYNNFRTVTTLDGVVRLTLTIRRCPNPDCPRFLRPYRPEAESHFALPHHEFGLDVMATVGQLRYAEHRSIPEIHRELTRRGLVVAVRTVTNLLDRYDELRALASADPKRLEPLLRHQRRVILAIDGLQPDVGHEVLWVLRDCLSGEILLAKSLLSSTAKDLAGLITEVKTALPVPITGVVSDGQGPIRKAVKKALKGVPHQLCHFHYLREAAKPISEADRHAKKELKKRVRGIRPIERQAEQTAEGDEEAEIVRDYCAAVRAALTDDGLPPLAGAGLKLHERLCGIAASLDRAAVLAGKLPGGLKRLQHLLRRGLEETAELWPPVREAFRWVKRVSRLLKNPEELPAKTLRRRLVQLLSRMRRAAATTAFAAVGAGLRHFLKVSKSYWPGLFQCYESPELPRTNNDLEHVFGSHRYHERRASGRRRASPGLVVMGAARLVSSVATRLRPEEGLVLRSGYVERWRELRARLEQRRESRRKQRRFRRDPLGYLTELEQRCLQLSLPA